MKLRPPRWLGRISIRLLAFNALLVFLPVVGMLVLDTYEQHLLQAQEKTMVQEGRLLAASLGGSETVDAEEAKRILVQLALRHEARLRVVDGAGRLLADSSVLGETRSSGQPEIQGAEPGVRRSLLYRLGSFPARLLRRLGGPRPSPGHVGEFYAGQVYLLGPEVHAALEGRYGATTRVTADPQRTVTLYSAIPIRGSERSVGAVLVSQSTNRIRQALYDVRLDVFRVFLASLAAATLLTLLVATTIARPLARLRRRAGTLLDARGRLRGSFSPGRRRDEIGDLERALAQLTERLENHLSFIEAFASDVSHEFKNPLASIRTATEMALEVPEPQDRRRFLTMIQREVARMERLLSGLREISRIDARLDEEELQPVPLDDLARSVVEAFRLRLGAAGPEITVSAPPGGLTARGSPDRLAQVIENLVDNAVGFSPRGAAVRLTLRASGARVLLDVADRGPGVPHEHRERVFSRFFSYRPGTPDEGDHAGLGLPIVRSIVESYGGTISVADRPGGGAVFTVDLPRADPPRTA